jgi:sarcosine oxidase delta subunit
MPKSSVCVPLNDSEKIAWEWAQQHDFWKGRITTPEQLRANLTEDKAFKVQFEQAVGQFSTQNLLEPRVENLIDPGDKNICPYCKDTGQIRFMRPDGTLTKPLHCKHGQQALAYIQSVKRDYKFDFVDASKLPKNRLTAKDCPYCNERGMLDLRNRSNGKADIRPCSHNPEKIKQLAREKDALIASAKPGYGESPSISSKKRGGGLRKLADVIGGLKADDDDVPF